MNWQASLAQGFSSAAALLTFLNLPINLCATSCEQQFKTRVPLGFAARMEPGNPHDPLLLQVLASAQELLVNTAYQMDPLQEHQFNPLPGLIHKYYGRVLLLVTGVCAINCRYCFRRHFSYSENTFSLFCASLKLFSKSIYEMMTAFF